MRLVSLVADLIDERLDETGTQELRELLRGSAEARAYYRAQTGFHARLLWLLGTFEEGRAEVLSEDRRETEALFQRREMKTRTWWGAAALVAGAAIAIFFLVQDEPKHAEGAGMDESGVILSYASGVAWDSGSQAELAIGKELSTRIYAVERGFFGLITDTGVRVYLQGPCRFEPVSPMFVRVYEGRVNVEVTGEEGHGFTIWTPAGEFVDLGTRFGLGVGSDQHGKAVVLSEVFDGEVRMKTNSGSGRTSELLEKGDTRSLINAGDRVKVAQVIDNRPIGLQFSRYEGSSGIEKYRLQDDYNIALGKQVLSNGDYYGDSGEIFPAKNLTDGRINDTGVPGNWSFWLGPNLQRINQVVIDLEGEHTIDCLQLLNTRNRMYGDRGTEAFQVFVAPSSGRFQRIGSGRLPRILDQLEADSPPPIETYVFEPVRARYLSILVTDFFRADKDWNNGSAGLNEVRVFSTETPPEIRAEIVDHAHALLPPPADDGNLAFGKPVSGSECFSDRFLGENVVDGVIDDCLVKDRYSCWLTPDGQNGHFVVDLGKIWNLDRVEIQNTGNGTYLDRGTKRYRLLLSENGSEYREVAMGTLEQVDLSLPLFVPIRLAGERARFIKFVAESHYGRGAGLSELRAYPSPSKEN